MTPASWRKNALSVKSGCECHAFASTVFGPAYG